MWNGAVALVEHWRVLASRLMRELCFKRVLGRGSMGTVYAAELIDDAGVSRECAAKVLKKAGSDREGFRRRLRAQIACLEARPIDTLTGVEEVLRVNDLDVVISRLLDAVDVGRILEKGRMPARAVAELGVALSGGLAELHSRRDAAGRRMVHQDVKPTNILITAGGKPFLVDFGLARATYVEREQHTQGLVLGTLNYYAPEVLAGASPAVESDGFALGIILWECAAGGAWGPPLFHRPRFQKRVEERFASLDADGQPLMDVLRGLLLWEPRERATMVDIHQRFQSLVEQLEGPGLVAWADSAVADVKNSVRRIPSDGLMGRTLKVGVQTTSPAEPDLGEAATLENRRGRGWLWAGLGLLSLAGLATVSAGLVVAVAVFAYLCL